ncbi:methyltransferase domain-containing protein [Nocardia sp. NPDC051030]|uniref:class I SAM-dependent methyltransferase n=1 Tax=Nocardia sp. NPDC051030 TaxID=3155162 RepID=UPI00341CD850
MGDHSEWEVENTELHARRANSFGSQAAVYSEHRPDYPLAGIRWALESVADLAGPEVLDLGAGTGKLTGGLLELGARVTAIEPDDSMRAELERLYPKVPTASGTAESIPLPDNSVDAVLVGQAFHWFNQSEAFPEIARVLRPGGVLAAFWNAPDDTVDWVTELDKISHSSASFTQRTSNSLPAHPLFHPFERSDFPHTHRCTAETLTTTISTHSHILVISPEERTQLLSRMMTLLRANPETATGEFDYPLRTLTIRTTLR